MRAPDPISRSKQQIQCESMRRNGLELSRYDLPGGCREEKRGKWRKWEAEGRGETDRWAGRGKSEQSVDPNWADEDRKLGNASPTTTVTTTTKTTTPIQTTITQQ